MILVGLDPGSAKSGWCRVSVAPPTLTGARQVTFLDAGTVESAPDHILALLTRVDAVAVEKVEGYAFGGTGKGGGVVAALIESSGVGRGISWLAHSKAIPCVEMSALEWRKTVLGQPSATDATIKRVIPSLIRGFPKTSNVHVRDAAGVALGTVWARRWSGVRVRVQPAGALAAPATCTRRNDQGRSHVT